jgi:hypothetical protein
MLAMPALIGGLRLILGLRRPFDLAGDAAILEAAIRRVAHGTQLLGPYSRFGFKQPGPAYFFVQAPFYWAGRGSARALYLGALCINLGAAIGSVLVVRRFLGEPAARWAAIVVGSFLVVLTPALLADPWNPYVLALPLLLTALLSGAAAAGSGAAASGAVVVGSYLVQTHLATGPTIVALFAVAGVVRLGMRLTGRGGGDRRWLYPGRRRLALGLGAAVALAVLWVPPLVEQAIHSPGNLTALATFFRERHPDLDRGFDHGVPAAADSVAAQLTVLPFGRRLGAEPAGPARVAAAGAGLLVAAAVAGAGWRRRAFVVALGGCSLAATMTAVWSVTRVVGEVFPYLLVWISELLLPAWIGAGALVLDRRPALWANRIVLVVAAVVGIVLGWSMLRAPLPPVPSAAGVGAVSGLAGPRLHAAGARQVRVRFGEFDQWPLAAGVLVRLEKDGFDVTVDHQWTALFGDQFAPTGHEDAALWLTAPAAGAPPGTEATSRLGVVGGAAVWAGRVAAR